MLTIYVSHRGVNLIGHDGQDNLHIAADPREFVSAIDKPARDNYYKSDFFQAIAWVLYFLESNITTA